MCGEVDAVCDPFEAMSPGTDRLIKKAEARVQDTNWDIAVCITDVPVRSKERVVVSEISVAHRVALLLTVGFGALMFFLLLFVVAVTAAVVVIPPDHLAHHIGEAATGGATSPSP